VLKRLGATPLSRAGLIAAKTVTVIAVELLQGALILIVAVAIGWRPDASPSAVVVVPLLILLGTAAFSGLALLMAGRCAPRPRWPGPTWSTSCCSAWAA
jgi:ABC-2 type transporter.